MTQLSDSALVMVWRRVEDLDQSEALLRGNGIAWDRISREKVATRLFDGDSALLGLWTQTPTELIADHAAQVDFEANDMVLNPASELLVRPPSDDLRDTVAVLKAALFSEANVHIGEVSEEASFADPSGNVFTFAAQNASVLPEAGTFFLNATLRGDLTATPIIGLRRLVSDLQRSAEYYRDVIEMPLVGGIRELRFASGLCNLALSREDYVGSIMDLRNRNRLVTDWTVLRVDSIETTLQELSAKNVTIKNGIEQTRYGPLIHFTDPDGHSIVFWQEPNTFPDGEQDVRPFVHRILNKAGEARGQYNI